MTANSPIQICIEDNVIARLVQYCADHQLDQFMLVADQNTYPVLGQAVEAALKNQGADIKTVILTGEEVVPDEQSIMQVLVQAGRQDRTYLAVGSGVITDITERIARTQAEIAETATVKRDAKNSMQTQLSELPGDAQVLEIRQHYDSLIERIKAQVKELRVKLAQLRVQKALLTFEYRGPTG